MSCNTFDRNYTRCGIVPVPRQDFTEADIIDLEAFQANRKAAELAISESNKAAADIDRRRRAYPHSNELRMVQQERERKAVEAHEAALELAARPWWKRVLNLGA